jgi:uncharacterized Zn-finger protein
MSTCTKNPRSTDHIWIDGGDGMFQECMYCRTRR